jgi:hypothetical protein
LAKLIWYENHSRMDYMFKKSIYIVLIKALSISIIYILNISSNGHL